MRSRQKDRPSSSGRSRSARYVEEEVERMMKEAEEKGSFRSGHKRPTHTQRDAAERQDRELRREENMRQHTRTGSREIKLAAADTREPLKRRKRATSELTPRSHKEHPDRYARRGASQQRGPSPEVAPKRMPKPHVATGSNAMPVQRAILRPRLRDRSRSGKDTQEDMPILLPIGASRVKEHVTGTFYMARPTRP
eukprot:5306375-Amphidinium_carterae.2